MILGGAIGSENVGMSNHNTGEIPVHRKPKVSLAMNNQLRVRRSLGKAERRT